MTRHLASALLALALLLDPVFAQDAAPPSRDGQLVRTALEEIRRGNWTGARTTAERAGTVAATLVEWHRLRDGLGQWPEFRAFADRNPDWPGLDYLIQQGEEKLPGNASPGEVVDYFAGFSPATADGAIELAISLYALGDTAAAEAEATRVWREMALTATQEEALLRRFEKVLEPHHPERLDSMLWRGLRAQAERMLPRLDNGYSRLARARLALRERAAGVDGLVNAVPEELADDPGLAWERFDWRISRQFYDSATELLLERSDSGESLGRPEAWARWRAWLARRALGAGNYRLAYDVAASHHLSSGGDYADLEWLAGYIALRHLDDAQAALGHFQHLRSNVGSPISLGRAGYWEGRAHEALGDMESARAAYAFGGEHQTSFYGLLAAEKAGLPMDPALKGDEAFPDWRTTSFADSTVLEAALLLRAAGEWHLARRFVLHLAEHLEREELGALADLVLALNEPNWAVNIAKAAATRGIILPRAYFPVTEIADMEFEVPTELALAIARRESEFDPAIVSPADARGLMQVLPGTAQLMARRMGLPYEAGRLTTDPEYNARLGAGYLAQMHGEFRNFALTAAAYNAGPGRPRRWVEELGDPRHPDVDPIDWIEAVPFTETRNYIMRVMETLYGYRARLNGPVEIRLSEELKAG